MRSRVKEDGSLLGPGWKYVYEWPDNAAAGPSRRNGSRREEDVVEAMDRMEVSGVTGEGDQEDIEDDEYEIEEEEFYLTLDFGHFNDSAMLSAYDECQLIGLDTPKPILKIGNKVYQGSSQVLIGSEMIFRDDRDPSDPTKHYHRPFTHTSNRMTFHPVTLQPRDPVTGEVYDKDGGTQQSRAAMDPVGEPRAQSQQAEDGVPGGELADGRPPRTRVPRRTVEEYTSTDSDEPAVQAEDIKPDISGEAELLLPTEIAEDGKVRIPGQKRGGGRKKQLITMVNEDGQEVQVAPPRKVKPKSKEFPTVSKNGKRLGRPPKDGLDPQPQPIALSDGESAAGPSRSNATEPAAENVIDNPLLSKSKTPRGSRGAGRKKGTKNRPIEERLAESLIKEARKAQRAPRKNALREMAALAGAGGAQAGPGPTSLQLAEKAAALEAAHFSADEGDDDLMEVDE